VKMEEVKSRGIVGYVKQEPPSWREVLKQLIKADEHEPSHDVRDMVLRHYKVSGGSLDIWNSSNQRRMAEAITLTEDEIELRTDCKNRRTCLLTLAKVRRRLEVP
jgi:hypothetical protein